MTWPVAAAHADPGDEGQDDVLRRDPRLQAALHLDRERLRLRLEQALGGEHVAHLAGADAEGQGPEGAVGARVAVAADDGHARLGEAQLGADHVHDALALAAQGVEGDAELAAVLLEGLDLGRRLGVREREAAVQPAAAVGVEWSMVATVRSGRRTLRPRSRSSAKAWGEVTSWTRCRST